MPLGSDIEKEKESTKLMQSLENAKGHDITGKRAGK